MIIQPTVTPLPDGSIEVAVGRFTITIGDELRVDERTGSITRTEFEAEIDPRGSMRGDLPPCDCAAGAPLYEPYDDRAGGPHWPGCDYRVALEADQRNRGHLADAHTAQRHAQAQAEQIAAAAAHEFRHSIGGTATGVENHGKTILRVSCACGGWQDTILVSEYGPAGHDEAAVPSAIVKARRAHARHRLYSRIGAVHTTSAGEPDYPVSHARRITRAEVARMFDVARSVVGLPPWPKPGQEGRPRGRRHVRRGT